MYAQTAFLWPQNIVSSFCNRFVWQYVHSAQQQRCKIQHTARILLTFRRRCCRRRRFAAHFILSVYTLFGYFRAVVVALLFVVVVAIELVCSVFVYKDSKSICVLPAHPSFSLAHVCSLPHFPCQHGVWSCFLLHTYFVKEVSSCCFELSVKYIYGGDAVCVCVR